MVYLLTFLCLAFVLTGLAVVYWPLALIVAGLLCGLAAWFIDFDREAAK